jgi:Tfp pilus assembly protein PilO
VNGTTSKNVGPYIVAGIVSVFLIVIAYMMFFVPKMAESSKLVAQAATAHANNAELTARVDKLQGIARNLDPLKAQIGEFNQSFPSAARQQEMIDAINAAAGSTGVTLKTLSPNVPAPKTADAPAAAAPAANQAQQAGTELPGPAPVPTPGAAVADGSTAQLGTVTLKIDGEGSLEAVQAFIVKVENLKRPLLVHELSIEKLESSYHVTFNGETFLSAPLVEPKTAGSGQESEPATSSESK